MTRIKIWLSAGLFALIGFQSASSVAGHLGCPDPSGFPTSSGCSLTGIRDSGFPYFDQGVSVKYQAKKDGDFFLKAKQYKKSGRSSLVMDSTTAYDVDKVKYKLRPVKVRDGVASGKLTIKGIIDGLGITKRETLMTAELDGDWALSADGKLLGFETIITFCHAAFEEYCSQAESIYLALKGAINTGKKNIKTTGVAVTTIPLPAAVWLFGSGLIGMAVMARRRRTNMG